MTSDKVNILVVDDLPEKLLAFQTILEELGENLVLARSGEEALRRLLEQDFAVILLDVNMPILNGFETASMIRARRKSALTPIIFITAFSDEVHTAQGYSLGAVDYILTPVVPEILRTKVKVFVDLFRMTERVRRQGEQQVVLAREQAARAAAEEANERLAYLAEASRVLASSLDLEETLRELVKLALRRLGDKAAAVLIDERGHPSRIERGIVNPDNTVTTRSELTLDELPPLIPEAIRRVLVRQKREIMTGDDHHRIVLPLLARGRLLGVLAIARSGKAAPQPHDVTLAEELAGRAAIALDNARLYHNIQEGDRRKSEFLSMLAHELRNPLAPIRNAVALFDMSDLSDPDLMQSCQIIDRQVTHMTRLIDDLLDVSRLSRGKILLRREAVNFTELIRVTAEDYRGTLEKQGIPLEVVLPDEPLWVWGDPTRLAQVVGNVLNNAAKFTDAGGQVGIELKADPAEKMTLTIRDTGIGMDAAMLNRVFETFAQADSSLDRSKGGLGLGLALVKGLIELHNGEVQVDSAGPGRGTEVTIRLPRYKHDPDQSSVATPDSVEQPKRILIVEDSLDAARSMQVLLTRMGHEVHVAHTGEEGLNVARSIRPEVILCDLGLPGSVDGFQFAAVARRDALLATVYLIAVTGYGQAEDRRKTQEVGFDAHLTKPVDLAALRRLLASVPVRE